MTNYHFSIKMKSGDHFQGLTNSANFDQALSNLDEHDRLVFQENNGRYFFLASDSIESLTFFVEDESWRMSEEIEKSLSDVLFQELKDWFSQEQSIYHRRSRNNGRPITEWEKVEDRDILLNRLLRDSYTIRPSTKTGVIWSVGLEDFWVEVTTEKALRDAGLLNKLECIRA